MAKNHPEGQTTDRFGRKKPLDELDLDCFAEGVGKLDERLQR